MQTIKVGGMESARDRAWRNLAARTINAQIRVGNLNIGYGALSRAILSISNVPVIYVAASQAIGGTMTIRMITAFIAYKVQFEQSMTALLEFYVQFKLLDVHLERISDIAFQKKEPQPALSVTDRAFSGEATLNNVSFGYTEQKNTDAHDQAEQRRSDERPGQRIGRRWPTIYGGCCFLGRQGFFAEQVL